MDPKDALLLSATHDSPRAACMTAGLEEHPLAPRDVWLASVNTGATDDGYWDWVEDTLESAWADLQLKLPPVFAKKVAAPGALMAQSQAIMRRQAKATPQLSTHSLETLVNHWEKQEHRDES